MKKILLIFSLALLIIGQVGYHGTASAKSNGKIMFKVHENMIVNKDTMPFLTINSIKKGNKKFFNSVFHKENIKYGFIDLSLQLEYKSDKEAQVTGSGVLKVLNETYPISLNGLADVYNIDNTKVIEGPVKAIIKKGGENYSAIVGLFVNPKTNQSIASVTIGAISENTAFVIFGEPTKTSKEVFSIKRKNNTPNEDTSRESQSLVSTPNTMSSPIGENVITQPGGGGGSTCYSPCHGKFSWENGTATSSLAFNNGTTHYSSYDTLILNAFDRQPADANGNGSVEVRAWTNSKAIEAWAQDNDYYTDSNLLSYWTYHLTVGLKTTSSHGDDIDISNWYPEGGSYQAWQWLGLIPEVGTYLQYLANTLVNNYNNMYTSSKTISTYGTWVYNKQLITKNIGTGADVPNISDTSYDTRGYYDGGLTTEFGYNAYYTEGTTIPLTAYASTIYEGQNGNLYNGYFYTNTISTTWYPAA